MYKTFIMIPTYNEKDNITALLTDLHALQIPGHEIHTLVVDDESPDETYELVKDFSKTNSRSHLLLRYKRKGRGLAGIDGFKTALSKGADFVLEMDADFSHHPRFIPSIVSTCEKNDIVIGSRFVPGGSDNDRGPYRRILTIMAGLYIRNLLGLQVKDVSSGFRCFKKTALEKIDLENLFSFGPSILLEMLYKASQHGLKIAEVPIVFIDRRLGNTKLNWVTLIETMVMVLKLRDLKLRGRLFQ